MKTPEINEQTDVDKSIVILIDGKGFFPQIDLAKMIHEAAAACEGEPSAADHPAREAAVGKRPA